MMMNAKGWFNNNVDIIQLVVAFSAMVVALGEVIEKPGSLAMLLGLVALSVGFGASLAILVGDRYRRRRAKSENRTDQ